MIENMSDVLIFLNDSVTPKADEIILLKTFRELSKSEKKMFLYMIRTLKE